MKISSLFRSDLISYRDFYIVRISLLGRVIFLVHGVDTVFHSLGMAKKYIDDWFTERVFNSVN